MDHEEIESAAAAPDALDIHIAAEKNSSELKRLLETGLSVNTPDTSNQATPLHYAVRAGNIASIRILLAHGANMYAFDKSHKTPAIYAAELAQADAFNIFMGSGLDLNAKTDHFRNTFKAALVKSDSCIALQRMIDAGAKINQRDSEGWTSLDIFGDRNFNIDKVRLLLENGAVSGGQNNNLRKWSLDNLRTLGDEGLLTNLVMVGALSKEKLEYLDSLPTDKQPIYTIEQYIQATRRGVARLPLQPLGKTPANDYASSLARRLSSIREFVRYEPNTEEQLAQLDAISFRLLNNYLFSSCSPKYMIIQAKNFLGLKIAEKVAGEHSPTLYNQLIQLAMMARIPYTQVAPEAQKSAGSKGTSSKLSRSLRSLFQETPPQTQYPDQDSDDCKVVYLHEDALASVAVLLGLHHYAAYADKLEKPPYPIGPTAYSKLAHDVYRSRVDKSTKGVPLDAVIARSLAGPKECENDPDLLGSVIDKHCSQPPLTWTNKIGRTILCDTARGPVGETSL